MRMLVVLHLGANAIVLWLAYYWLGVAEADTSGLLWSAALALLVLVLSCWTYGAALRHFQLQESAGAAWRRVLGNLPPLFATVLMVGVVYWLLARWEQYSSQPAFQIASYFTLKSRSALAPDQRFCVSSMPYFGWCVGCDAGAVLPLRRHRQRMAGVGCVRSVCQVRRWVIGSQTPLCWLVCTCMGALRKLFSWVPGLESLPMQMTSFWFRAGAAYLFFVAAWLGVGFVTAVQLRGATRD